MNASIQTNQLLFSVLFLLCLVVPVYADAPIVTTRQIISTPLDYEVYTDSGTFLGPGTNVDIPVPVPVNDAFLVDMVEDRTF